MKRILSFLLFITLSLQAVPTFGMSRFLQRAAQPFSRYFNRAQGMPSVTPQMRQMFAQAQKSPLFTQRAFMSTYEQKHQKFDDHKQDQNDQKEKSKSWKDYFYDAAYKAKKFAKDIASNKAVQLAASFSAAIPVGSWYASFIEDKCDVSLSLKTIPPQTLETSTQVYVVDCSTKQELQNAYKVARKAGLGSESMTDFFMRDGLKIAKLSDETVIGYCMYSMPTLTTGYIYYLAIDEASQKRGYGTLLIHAVLKELKNKGATEVILSSVWDAEGFYQRIGFENAPKYSSCFVYRFENNQQEKPV